MNSSFTTRDLIELALLDAMGLLDDGERAEFERAFSATSPTIQAQVRREQTRLADLEFLLPQVEPAADLRSAVIEAVRRAMAEDARHSTRQRAAFVPALIPSQRVSPLWRAGAMGFATAAVVFGFTTLQQIGRYDELGRILRNNEFTDQTLPSLGPSVEDSIFNENIRHILFRPVAGVQGKAVLLLNGETGEASLICRKLPSEDGREYKLVVLNADGAIGEQLASFMSNGLIAEPIRIRLSNGQRLAILPPAGPDGPTPAPIFTTDPIRI